MAQIVASVLATFTLVAISVFKFPKVECSPGVEFASICCDWDGESRVNLMPHPIRCSLYYQCQPMQNLDGSYYLHPTQLNCPLDEAGNTMYFDFPSCRCIRGHEVTCYDDNNMEHYLAFYNCSEKFYKDGRTLPCF